MYLPSSHGLSPCRRQPTCWAESPKSLKITAYLASSMAATEPSADTSRRGSDVRVASIA